MRKADQIELVDSSPEQLRRRMLHGNIYPKEKVPQALTHFFRTDNLIALRELALRFLADETRGGAARAPAAPPRRGPMGDQRTDPGGGHRRAGHRCASSGGPPGWPPGSRPTFTSSTSSPATAAAPSDGEAVGPCARWPPTSAPTGTRSRPTTPPKRLIEFAREHQITQIVVGSSSRSRWQELKSGGSIVRKISSLAAAAGIDVHIIARRDAIREPGETSEIAEGT